MLGVVRLRRYRSLLLFALIAVIVFFHFYSFSDTRSSFSVDKLKEYTATVSKLSPPKFEQEKPVKVDLSHEAPILPPSIPPIEKPSPRPEVPAKEDKPKPAEDKPKPKPADPIVDTPKPKSTDVPKASDKLSHQENRPSTVLDIAAPEVLPPEHWVNIPEHYPIAKEDIIPLPKKYKKLPQIQADFARELGSKRAVRLERQKAVKDAMLHTWKGYRQYAWLHDELSPVSRYYRDPFAGWGATLVDALDTLWIMGLEEEFLEAVEAVGKIDFTTTPTQSIPVFETVIRYLGGLIGAYDVSGGKHQVLLDKAIELGDMLYGVFDTPNRMPLLHWGWRPRQNAKPFRAELRAVSAELGSLSVEFTRLAQITGNNSYFDAVQRITDALEEFQPKTGLPGMWPVTIDTSGCRVVQAGLPPRKTVPESVPLPPNGIFADTTSKKPPGAGPNMETQIVPVPVHKHDRRHETEASTDWLAAAQGHITPEEDETKQEKPKPKPPTHPGLTVEAQSQKIHHEEETEGGGRSNAIGQQLAAAATSTIVAPIKTSPSCVPQGLKRPSFQRDERYTLGGMSDSLYEYLIKEYILLGGADQYGRMYEKAIDQAKKYLFFRPLADGDPDVLLSGNVNVINGDLTFDTDSGHLSCFTGGMLALGARALGREADIEVGAKLTDGCVWAYASFESGLMPESFKAAYCRDAANCKFDATEYYEQLVPKYRRPKKPAPEPEVKPEVKPEELEEPKAKPGDKPEVKPEVNEEVKPAAEPHQHAKRAAISDAQRHVQKPATPVVNSDTVQEDYPTTLEGIAKLMIDAESLPTGFTRVMDRRYILRPEAIESVFIMYRLTADTTWQDKGWRMWQSVEKATRTEFGFSAINDVTRGPSDPHFIQLDEMESFWLAETLKYYYLLFSEPDLVSLDDYVLNTEAHPLRRPRPSS